MLPRKPHNFLPGLGWGLLAVSFLLPGAQPAPPNPQIVNDFEKRVADYVKLRNQAESGMPHLRAKATPAMITAHERDLQKRIQEARPSAQQGAIFTPEITAEFRRLIAGVLQGADGLRIRRSLSHAEPVNVPIRINQPWPHGIPLQNMPPSILGVLPSLPKELEYRLNGHELLLRDIGANLVVDFAPNVFEPEQ